MTTTAAITSRHEAMQRRLLHDLATEVAAGTYTVEVVRGAVLDNARYSPDPLGAFCRLVQAVADLTVYCQSAEAEGRWLCDHRILPTAENRETYYGVIEERIEHALDELMARAAA